SRRRTRDAQCGRQKDRNGPKSPGPSVRGYLIFIALPLATERIAIDATHKIDPTRLSSCGCAYDGSLMRSLGARSARGARGRLDHCLSGAVDAAAKRRGAR